MDSTAFVPPDSEYRILARYPASFSSFDGSIVCQPWRMRAVGASGTCTVPFEVDRDRIPAEASYLSIVPSILNVVAEANGPDCAASACANAGAPETTAADINRTESPFLMTASCWRVNRTRLCNVKRHADPANYVTIR